MSVFRGRHITSTILGKVFSSRSKSSFIFTNGGYRVTILLGGYWIALVLDASEYNYYSELFWTAGLFSVVTSWSASNWFINELRHERLGFDSYVASVVVTAAVSIPLGAAAYILADGDIAYVWVLSYSVLFGSIQNFIYLRLYMGAETTATRLVLSLLAISVAGYVVVCGLKTDPAVFFQTQTILAIPIAAVILATHRKHRISIRFGQVLESMRIGVVYVPAAATAAILFVFFQYQINRELTADAVRLVNLGLPLIGVLGFAVSNVVSVNVKKLLDLHRDVSLVAWRASIVLGITMFAFYVLSLSLDIKEPVVFAILMIAGLSNGASFLFPILASVYGNHRIVFYVSVVAFAISFLAILNSSRIESLVFSFSLFFVFKLAVMSRVSR